MNANASWPRAEPPHAVTFDCWNTLLVEESWDGAHRLRVDALLDAAREAGRDVSVSQAGFAFDRAWERHMALWRAGVASGAREVARWALERLEAPVTGPPFDHLVDHFENASHTGRVIALPGAAETLERLAAAGVRLALICDTGLTPGRVVRQHLDRLGLLDSLDATLFSDEVGVPKPDPRIFQAALEALDVGANAAAHVGDLRRTDVGGARGVGMASVRLASPHDDSDPLPEADVVASSHSDVQRLLAVA